MESKTVADILRSRRDILKLGGLGLLAASVDAAWPLNVGATGSKVQPRASARNVVFYELSGALSHVESFDFKENPGTPKDLDVRAIAPDLSLSHLLFPRVEKQLDQTAIELLEERWRLLSELRKVEKTRVAGYGRQMAGYDDFYETAHRLLSDERWPAAFHITEEDRKRYGNTSVGVSCILARNVLAEDAGTHHIHICHPGWDHHVKIWDRGAESNHYVLCAEFDPAFSSLLEDLAATRSKTDQSKTLLDETLVVVAGEFGRTPGALNYMAGRDHYNRCYPALFAGAGVKGGRVLGRTDSAGAKCLDTGWNYKEQPRTENVVATIYSALGIDWTKEIRNTPSGRTYVYVDPLGPNGYIPTDDITTIYG